MHCVWPRASCDRLANLGSISPNPDHSGSSSWAGQLIPSPRINARAVPEDRLLVETDAPFLAPPPHRGKRNEPAFVVEVARKVAALRGQTPEAVGAAAARNFARLFRRD